MAQMLRILTLTLTVVGHWNALPQHVIIIIIIIRKDRFILPYA